MKVPPDVEVFLQHLYDKLEGDCWGVIDWEGDDREDFRRVVREAWDRAALD